VHNTRGIVFALRGSHAGILTAPEKRRAQTVKKTDDEICRWFHVAIPVVIDMGHILVDSAVHHFAKNQLLLGGYSEWRRPIASQLRQAASNHFLPDVSNCKQLLWRHAGAL